MKLKSYLSTTALISTLSFLCVLGEETHAGPFGTSALPYGASATPGDFSVQPTPVEPGLATTEELGEQALDASATENSNVPFVGPNAPVDKQSGPIARSFQKRSAPVVQKENRAPKAKKQTKAEIRKAKREEARRIAAEKKAQETQAVAKTQPKVEAKPLSQSTQTQAPAFVTSAMRSNAATTASVSTLSSKAASISVPVPIAPLTLRDRVIAVLNGNHILPNPDNIAAGEAILSSGGTVAQLIAANVAAVAGFFGDPDRVLAAGKIIAAGGAPATVVGDSVDAVFALAANAHQQAALVTGIAGGFVNNLAELNAANALVRMPRGPLPVDAVNVPAAIEILRVGALVNAQTLPAALTLMPLIGAGVGAFDANTLAATIAVQASNAAGGAAPLAVDAPNINATANMLGGNADINAQLLAAVSADILTPTNVPQVAAAQALAPMVIAGDVPALTANALKATMAV
ncbi:MAG TPA: hypothetical protein PK010_04250, partial [Alphaproteobacteria bacterium]|nr:hypothetical protein [Alphaproteobacteria bacterium]